MATPQLPERHIEEIIQKHHDYFIEPGLRLKGRQVMVKGGRADLLFDDRFGDELIIEIKRGTANREAVAQLLDYLGNLTSEGTRTRLMLIAGNIAANWKMALDRQGIEYREYTEKDYLQFLEAHDKELLKRITTTTSSPPPPPPEPPSNQPLNLCGSLKDFLSLRNFKAGEGITEKSVEQWLVDRSKAKERYRAMFHPGNLDKMKAADFKSFLYFKNNRCWTQLYRRSLRLINDMEALRRAIAHLQDESIPVEIRLRDVLHGGSYWMNGLGINIATAILHICDQNDRYGVWNNRTEDALSKLGYLKQRVYDRGKDYLMINGCLHDLEADLRKCKPDLSIDLDFVDSFVWFISKDKLDYVEGTPRSEANFTIPPKPDLTIQSTSAPENLLSLINAFEKDVRNHVKERLGANYEKILNSTTPELVEKWHWRRRRDSENGKPTEPEIINYAEMGDYINILLRNREAFNKEGYFISDVITYLKKISYNRGKAAHPRDKPLDIQQIYATKDAIEWIQAWIRAK